MIGGSGRTNQRGRSTSGDVSGETSPVSAGGSVLAGEHAASVIRAPHKVENVNSGQRPDKAPAEDKDGNAANRPPIHRSSLRQNAAFSM
jgi:hypothetical protein